MRKKSEERNGKKGALCKRKINKRDWKVHVKEGHNPVRGVRIRLYGAEQIVTKGESGKKISQTKVECSGGLVVQYLTVE